MTLLIYVFLALTLIQISVSDIRNFRIRNEAVALLALLFIAYAAASETWRSAPGHAAFALAMFAALIVPYLLDQIGGGDVKMLVAAFLWTGLQNALPFSIILLIFICFHYVLGRLGLTTLKLTPQGNSIPFGPSIAAALAVTLALSRP